MVAANRLSPSFEVKSLLAAANAAAHRQVFAKRRPLWIAEPVAADDNVEPAISPPPMRISATPPRQLIR